MNLNHHINCCYCKNFSASSVEFLFLPWQCLAKHTGCMFSCGRTILIAYNGDNVPIHSLLNIPRLVQKIQTGIQCQYIIIPIHTAHEEFTIKLKKDKNPIQQRNNISSEEHENEKYSMEPLDAFEWAFWSRTSAVVPDQIHSNGRYLSPD